MLKALAVVTYAGALACSCSRPDPARVEEHTVPLAQDVVNTYGCVASLIVVIAPVKARAIS